MTKNELIKNLAWLREEAGLEPAYPINHPMAKFIMAISERAKAQEREALEVELLKLKQGVAANSDYIQGRWDLIGEFQDIIRSRS